MMMTCLSSCWHTIMTATISRRTQSTDAELRFDCRLLHRLVKKIAEMLALNLHRSPVNVSQQHTYQCNCNEQAWLPMIFWNFALIFSGPYNCLCSCIPNWVLWCAVALALNCTQDTFIWVVLVKKLQWKKCHVLSLPFISQDQELCHMWYTPHPYISGHRESTEPNFLTRDNFVMTSWPLNYSVVGWYQSFIQGNDVGLTQNIRIFGFSS